MTQQDRADTRRAVIVQGERDLVTAYLDEVSKLPALTDPQASRLARDGERTRLAQAHLRLVVDIARRYQGQGMRVLDLISAGNQGLLRAVDRFDGAEGFAAFATPWIATAIHRALDVAQHPRVPGYDEPQNNLDARRLNELLDELPPRSAADVARELGFNAERARSYASRMVAALEVEPSEADRERATRTLDAGGA